MVLKVLIAFLWAGVKYLISVALCFGMFSNPFVGFLVSTAGALFGVIVFTYGGFWIEEKIKHRFFEKGKHFNKRTRMLVRLKHSGGLPLVAFLTPIIISVPIGCILATTFVHSREKIVLYMSMSFVFWGIIIFGAQWLFHIDLAQMLKGFFGK